MIASALFWLAASAAWAQAPALSTAPASEPVAVRALRDELTREMSRLRLDNLERPYYLSYSLSMGHFDAIECSFGAPTQSYGYEERELRADVRVGSAAFDNSHYVQSAGGYHAAVSDFPLDDDYDAMRAAAWSLTDDAYKEALETLSEKRAYKEARNITDEMPDLSSEPAHRALLNPAPQDFVRKDWEAPVCRLSALFKKYPAIQNSVVIMEASQNTRYFLDSEGALDRWPDSQIRITFFASSQGKDGMPAERRLRYVFRAVDEIHSQRRLEAEGEEFARSFSEWTTAPALGEYIGPVLFEGQASGEFFNQLLGRELANPRAPWVDNDAYSRWYPGGALANRVGLRVTAPFLDIVDDPTRADFNGIPLAGRYSVDEEGVPARPVRLVEAGRLKDLLLGRSPVKGHEHSNGHARGALRDVQGARSSSLIVTARETMSEKKLKKKLIALAKDAGLAYGLLVRRMAPDDQKDWDDPLSSPAELLKVYVKDGREERVRDADFSDVSLRALRDIVAASDDTTVYNFYQSGRLYGSQGDVPSSVAAPSVLVEEMELKKTDKKPAKLPYLKHPYFN